jgi:hypothetical protein
MGCKARLVGPLWNAKIISTFGVSCMVGKWRRSWGDERNGRTWLNLVLASTRFALRSSATVANQKIFRAPVRFDFLANGRHNGS